MILFDCAANSLEIEKYILDVTGLFKTPEDAKADKDSDRKLFKIEITVTPIEED